MELVNLSEKEILEIVKPLAEHTENSWNQKNYNAFCRYLLKKDSEQGFPEDDFNRQIEENYDTYGYHTIGNLVTIHRNPDHIVVIWKVEFENRKEPGLLIYSFKELEGKVLIDGCSYHA